MIVMKNLAKIFLCSFIFLAIFGVVYAENLPSDIEGNKYETAIEFLYKEGVVNGYSDGTFRPTYDLNRAELVKFVTGTKGENLDPNQYKNCFPDVKEEWYAKYICYGKSEGWISGYPDGFFRPGNQVNKAEAIKITVNAYKVKEEADTDLPFADVEEGDWYFVYVRAAFQNHLLEEKMGKFNPGANMNRGQISEIVYNILSPEDVDDDSDDSDSDDDDVVGDDGGGDDDDSTNDRTILTDDDLTYLGAFRLPDGGGGSKSRFGYGGGAMALNPDGDGDGANDGFPGSLYILGHDHDQLVSEVNIPEPKDQRVSGVDKLNSANFLQPFTDITEGLAGSTDDGNGYRVDGLAYLDAQGSQNDGNLYWTARTYYNVDTSSDLSHGMSDTNFSAPNAKGLWRLKDFHSSMTSGYIFPVPKYFADAYLDGKRLISGLFTQQGVSATSQGPAFFAYAPWKDALDGIAPSVGAVLDAVALTYYPYSDSGYIEGDAHSTEKNSAFPDFQIPDSWDAAAWLDTDDAHAVVVTGQRAIGKTFYGDARPGDCTIDKGYHGEPYEPSFLFYDPADLAKVAEGKMKPYEVVPYLEWDPSEYMVKTCLWGLTGAVYDRENHLFYVLHYNSDTTSGEPKPLIYVFRVGA